MTRAYHVVDAGGHILEPLNLWQDYMDPAFRDRAPRLIHDADGKERLVVEEQVLGSKKGMGALGAVGARDGTVVDDTMELTLFRLDHLLPGSQAHPEVMQRTAEFHHPIADTVLPQSKPMFDNATALDTTVDMLDPKTALVQ